MGGLSLLTTAPSPAVASPMPMVVTPLAELQVTWPVTFWFLPSTVTCGPAAAGAALDRLDAPGLDLLLEQPAQAATSTATPATPTTIPRFTTALPRVAGAAVSPSRPLRATNSSSRRMDEPWTAPANPLSRSIANATLRPVTCAGHSPAGSSQ